MIHQPRWVLVQYYANYKCDSREHMMMMTQIWILNHQYRSKMHTNNMNYKSQK
jgi:hypothetical protein